MPMWIDELQMVYVLVPRTGSSAFRKYLADNYSGLDLAHPNAVRFGLVQPDSGLSKHSTFREVRAAVTPALADSWTSIARVKGARNPADSLFSAWWKYHHTYPERIRDLDAELLPDRAFLMSDTVQEAIEQATRCTFSEWILERVRVPAAPSAPPASKAPSTPAAARLKRRLRSALTGGTAATAPPGTRAQPGPAPSPIEILRFESMDADWQALCERHDWPYRGAVPQHNTTADRPASYSDYLNEAAAQRLRQRYGVQLRELGYDIVAGAPG